MTWVQWNLGVKFILVVEFVIIVTEVKCVLYKMLDKARLGRLLPIKVITMSHFPRKYPVIKLII